MQSDDPAYRFRKTRTNQCRATVRLTDAITGESRDFWLGKYGSPESMIAYNYLLDRWKAHGCQLGWEIDDPLRQSELEGLTVTQLCHAFRFSPDVKVSASEMGCFATAMRVLRELHSATPARRFGPNALREVREAMVRGNDQVDPPRVPWSRKSINKQVGRIRAIWKWGVAHEMIPASVYEALRCLEPLKRGRCAAVEKPKVLPAPKESIAAVLPRVRAQVRAMIELQLVTGMRPGEVLTMRSCDIDTVGDVWVYRPAAHKMLHQERDRTIYLGPKAQEIVKPYLRRELDAPLFQPGEGLTRGMSKKHPPGRHYTVGGYRRAIVRACDAVGVTAWHPHQLRHNYATQVRSEFGLEAAQVMLDHSSAEITDAIYAERDSRRAVEVAARLG